MAGFTGQVAPDKTCWVVELTDVRGTGVEHVHAQHLRIDGGCAVFTNGVMATTSIVAVYGQGAFNYIAPKDVDSCHDMHLGGDYD